MNVPKGGRLHGRAFVIHSGKVFAHDEDSTSGARRDPPLSPFPRPCGSCDADAHGRDGPARPSFVADQSRRRSISEIRLGRTDD